MSEQLIITKINETYIRIDSEPSVEAELRDYFSFKMPGYQFSPKYKAGFWDGVIRLYNGRNKQIYIGLYETLLKFVERNDYELIEKNGPITVDNKINPDALRKWVNDLKIHSKGTALDVYEHQHESIYNILNEDRLTLESPTSSGKSLIIYAIIRMYLNLNYKVLVIVPTTQLCEQLYSDFDDYSTAVTWDVEDHVQKLYSGFTKVITKSVLVSTWQSLIKQPPSYYEQFDCVICDEVHLAKGASITSIMEKMIYTKRRVGMTGTLDDSKLNRLQICGLFGRVHKVITTKQLMDVGQVVPLDIKALIINHSEEDRKLIKGSEYIDEMKWINTLPARNNFIASLAGATKGNTLILVTWVDLHLKPLEEIIKDLIPHKKLLVIYGDVPPKEREAIRQFLTDNDDVIVLATFATTSTGVNMPSIGNIILGSSSKSKIRNLQSIGRGLRLSKGKTKCNLFDIADDLKWKKKDNHALRHFKERIDQYAKEEFDYKLVEVKI